MQGFWIGDLHYHSGFGYTTIGYKKNGLWGMLFVQTHSGSGGGMFPSTGFYVDGLGKMTRRENKYDQITISEKDNFYTTRLKDKYGFWEPITNEVYEPEFDSIPITKRKDYSTEDLPRHRFVKKNGKWGLIYLNESTQTIEYKVPCLCNALGGINAELYYCKGKDDTLQIYFTPTNKILKPIIEGNQIKLDFYWKPWDNDTHFTFQKYIGENTLILGNDSIFYELRLRDKQELILYKMKNIPEPFPVLGDYEFDKTTASVYAINIQENKIIFALTDTTCSYFSGYAPFIIINAHYNSKTKKYTRYFYDDQTGVLKFSITTQEKFLFMGEVKKEKRRGQTTWYKFTSSRTTSSDHGVVRGYYNLQTKKFSKRRK